MHSAGILLICDLNQTCLMSGRAYFHVSAHLGISEQRKLEAGLKEVKDDWVDNEKTLERVGDLFLNVLAVPRA